MGWMDEPHGAAAILDVPRDPNRCAPRLMTPPVMLNALVKIQDNSYKAIFRLSKTEQREANLHGYLFLAQ